MKNPFWLTVGRDDICNADAAKNRRTRRWYADSESLQNDLDKHMVGYTWKPTHQGRRCHGRTLMETCIDGKKFFNQKDLERRRIAA